MRWGIDEKVTARLSPSIDLKLDDVERNKNLDRSWIVYRLLLTLFSSRELNEGVRLPDGRPLLGLLTGSRKRDHKDALNFMDDLWTRSAPRFMEYPGSYLTDVNRRAIITRNMILCGADNTWSHICEIVSRPPANFDYRQPKLVAEVKELGGDAGIDNDVLEDFVLDLLEQSSPVADAAARSLDRVPASGDNLARVCQSLQSIPSKALLRVIAWAGKVANENDVGRSLISSLLGYPDPHIRAKAGAWIAKNFRSDDLDDAFSILAIDFDKSVSRSVSAIVPRDNVSKAIERVVASPHSTPAQIYIASSQINENTAVCAAFCEWFDELLCNSGKFNDGRFIELVSRLSLDLRTLPSVIWDRIERLYLMLEYPFHINGQVMLLCCSKPDDARARAFIFRILRSKDRWDHLSRQDLGDIVAHASTRDADLKKEILAFIADDDMPANSADALWGSFMATHHDELSQSLIATLIIKNISNGSRDEAVCNALHSSKRVEWCKSFAKAVAVVGLSSHKFNWMAKEAAFSRTPGTLRPLPRKWKDRFAVLAEEIVRRGAQAN